jgi:hypothetical protein
MTDSRNEKGIAPSACCTGAIEVVDKHFDNVRRFILAIDQYVGSNHGDIDDEDFDAAEDTLTASINEASRDLAELGEKLARFGEAKLSRRVFTLAHNVRDDLGYGSFLDDVPRLEQTRATWPELKARLACWAASHRPTESDREHPAPPLSTVEIPFGLPFYALSSLQHQIVKVIHSQGVATTHELMAAAKYNPKNSSKKLGELVKRTRINLRPYGIKVKCTRRKPHRYTLEVVSQPTAGEPRSPSRPLKSGSSRV